MESHFLNNLLMENSEKTLIEQVKQGNIKAFNQLYRNYKDIVYNAAYFVVKNKDVADDITSIVFTKAWYKKETFVDNISLKMWLKTIATNSAIDYIRRTKKEKLNTYIDDENSFIQVRGTESSPEEKMLASEKLDIVLGLIPKMKKKYRDILTYRIEGNSYKQIAKLLDSNEITIKSDLNKARQHLRKLYEQIV